jgi:hypothetical protein
MSDLFTKPPFNLSDYMTERNNIINTPEAMEQNKRIADMKERFNNADPMGQLKMLGAKGTTTAKVLTEAQDKARKLSKFAEDNIVGAWAKWFKMQYPNIPYVIDRKAQGKSRLRATIERAQDYKRGNPDIHIQTGRAGFIGAYIEQKRDRDELFYKGTYILKPGNDNRHIWQALYHAELREQGYYVMFSISLETTIDIVNRYMQGNPYKQRAYEYYCKPEDYPIFTPNKHFNPVKTRP